MDAKPNPPMKLTFADMEACGPGTPAGRYLRLFWQPLSAPRTSSPATPGRSR